jgi:ribonuclease T2
LLLALTLSGGRISARKRTPAAGRFDYLLLALTWAPGFCATAGAKKDARECGVGRKLAFVVHGLWPEASTGRGPEACGAPSPVARPIVQSMLSYIPSESLIQHEWKSHGTCSGLSQAEFFAAVRRARDSVAIPPGLQAPAEALSLSPMNIEEQFAAANPTFPRGAFRATCSRGGILSDVRVCFSKDLTPQECTSAAGKCPLPEVTVLPVR